MAGSRKYRFEYAHDLDGEARRVARGRAEHALEALRDELDREPGETVHTARKDLKKLRSLLRLLRSGLGDELYDRENDRLRAAGRALAGIRDAEVALETLEGVVAGDDDLLRAEAARAVRGTLLDERDRAHDGPGPRVAANEAEARLAVVAEGVRAWPDGLEHAVGAGMVRAYRRGRKRYRAARDEPSAERLHEWRKRAKDHWYHVRLVRDAWPDPLKARAGEVHRLTDLLGDDHDLAILAERIDRDVDAAGRSELLDAIERRRGELQAAAFDLGARVYAEKPKAFERRMLSLLEAWRGADLATRA